MLIAKKFFFGFHVCMKVSKCQNNVYTNFRAGLTPALRQDISNINVSSVERQFKALHIDCNLKNNKALAAMLIFRQIF